MKPGNIVAYLFLAVAWGFSFLLILKVVHAYGWVGAVSFRALVAGATLLITALVTRRRLDFSAGWQPFAVVGATTVAVQLLGLSLATPRIGTAMAAILVATIPLFSMVIAQLWGIERLTPRTLAGLLLGFAGVVLLVGFPAVAITPSFLFGCASSIASSIAAAFGSNYANRHLRGTGSWEITTGSFLAGGLLTLPLLLVAPVPAMPAPVDYFYLVVLGCVMSALTYVTYFRLVATIGATKAISVEFAVTLVAVIIGATFLGERLSALQLLGGAVVVCGCLLVLGLVPGRRRQPVSV